uniref:Uncharacterized protein n=1 Tax=Candidatus Kentrum sp. TC TaxID=2126339 RepID=A0A450Z0X6_9GAMM|nr:MAG: hypothetical protein BECKTC1821E_GA0114239_108513 [Candidatus Kentron sp. TC]VFK48456.1 MAG: hypothetical protein BECKTC1821D_GA0114238_106120 [Candidatus Kentron sp. TC]VFK61413.1 MAG: hypothetical protein BECKTC1821F_GA0114240_10581 [Candidatus Kentron sp. TC]
MTTVLPTKVISEHTRDHTITNRLRSQWLRLDAETMVNGG